MEPNQLIIDALRDKASAKTAAFSAKLTPNVSPDRFLGVKSADMKAVSKSLIKGELSIHAADFRAALPHPYIELNMIHVHTLNALTDPENWRASSEEFLPYIDNWMVTDAIDPELLKGKRSIGYEGAGFVIEAGHDWIQGTITRGAETGANTYIIRAGVIILLQALQKGHFSPEHLEWVAAIRHDDYYVHMVVGWYFATAFDKYEEITRPYLENNGVLELDSQRIAIRKIIESCRTSPENLIWARTKRTELTQIAKSN